MPELATAIRELTFGDAIKEAIAEEMRRDPTVVLMGEDVAEAGTTFKVLVGLVDIVMKSEPFRHGDAGVIRSTEMATFSDRLK